MNLTNLRVSETMTTKKGFAKFIYLTAAVATAAVSLPIMTAVPASAALAPRCVKVVEHVEGSGITGRDKVILRNDCRTTQRVKIITAFGRDMPCMSLVPSQTDGYTWPAHPRQFDRVDKC
ncbi:MAG: hypothetical protein KME43_04855 [Myxacorys chilensis ATA2-1-KO14]|nr:hypothetical protein [Myxacorys chilensis ATA2-1-KO14]